MENLRLPPRPRATLQLGAEGDRCVGSSHTGDHRRVAVPPEFDNEERTIWNGAVLCAAAGDLSHVHGGFCSCPFKVAVVGATSDNRQVFACIYSSETGKWSDLVATAVPFLVYCFNHPGTLLGNTLYWIPLGRGYGIVEFDLDRHSLAVIEWPSDAKVSGTGNSRIIVAEDGGLGLAVLSCHRLEMWERKVCSEGVENWVLHKSHKLQKILGQSARNFGKPVSSAGIIPMQLSMILLGLHNLLHLYEICS
ncbi:unnamed protein product [Urochloa humidicola]